MGFNYNLILSLGGCGEEQGKIKRKESNKEGKNRAGKGPQIFPGDAMDTLCNLAENFKDPR